MARGEMVDLMVKENVPKAMETVLGTPGNQGMVDVQFAIREWTMTDTVAASEWFAENDAKLGCGEA
ncbi:hypothetical protein [Luteolibacter luteus]|uniref:Uncharacterized protein n=1 Tax=Luteolibacter luteus TaxID=2728835 RepID=A0A858RMY7_9BACT|nr:hypothetical protein [Luteolibacter luteus]QJE98075.1 hypothetical protein HHL09_20565 [Luteolibacter luteus]